MKELIEMLHAGGYSCVIAHGDCIRTFTQRGVADLYDLLVTEPDFLQGASIADKVIGKAAASLMVLGGVAEVYTRTISEPALRLLQEAGAKVSCDEVVDHHQSIGNRQQLFTRCSRAIFARTGRS